MDRKLLGLRALLAVGLACAASALATGCEGLANIEDRELGQCGEFCDTVMRNCSGTNKVYETRQKCMAVCKLYDVGDPSESQETNTLACRLREARDAQHATEEEVSNHCRSAGPEGLECDGQCESYCQLYERSCGEVQCGSNANCVAKCKALRNKDSFNLTKDHDGNTVQCRLVHVSNSTVGGKATHCGHAKLSTPTEYCKDLPADDDGTGGGAASADPDIITEARPQDYCRVVTVACGEGDYAQYESQKQCEALAPYLTQGVLGDQTDDTLACRLYHSYNSLCDESSHCPHAGPGGEGHCGEPTSDTVNHVEDVKCIAYCRLAKGVCEKQYDSADGFDGDDDKCLEDCKTLVDHAVVEAGPDTPTRYRVSYAKTPGTLACRLLAVSRAAENGKNGSLCDTLAVFGKAGCAE